MLCGASCIANRCQAVGRGGWLVTQQQSGHLLCEDTALLLLVVEYSSTIPGIALYYRDSDGLC